MEIFEEKNPHEYNESTNSTHSFFFSSRSVAQAAHAQIDFYYMSTEHKDAKRLASSICLISQVSNSVIDFNCYLVGHVSFTVQLRNL